MRLTHERRVLLDRLATLGLGGPLFSLASSDDSRRRSIPVDPGAEEIEDLAAFRGRRPSKLADALTARPYRDLSPRCRPEPVLKWIPKVESVTAALDEAEAPGKKSSSLSI